MSDNIDPEQIKDLNEALKDLTDTVDGLSGAHRKTTTGLTAGIKEFTGTTDQQAKALSKLLTGLGTTVAGQTKAMYKGQQGAEVLAGSFDALGDAVFAVIALINPLGAAAAFVAKKLIGLAVDYGKAAAKQADQEYKAYQDLSRAGAATAGSLGDVLTSVQKFGYGLDEVDKMTKLIAENSESLAKFGITAGGGATAFGDAMNQLTHGETGRQLRELGKTTDDINTAGAAYIKQQVLQGRTQKDVNDNLAGSTKQYITDLDKLQRLTGTSAEALQKQQEEKYADSAYAAWIDRMKSGTVEQQAQAALVEKKIDALNAASPELGKLARRGIVDPSAQGMISQIAPALMDLSTNTDDVATTMEKTSGQIKQFQKNMGGLYEVNASGMDEQYINYSKLSQSAAGLADWHEKEAKAAADAAAPKDQALKNQVTIQQAEMDARNQLQSFVQFGVIPATNALKGIANIYKGGTGMLPGSPASGGAGGQGPGGGVADLQKQLGLGAAAGAGYKGPAGAVGQQVVGSSEARAKAEGYYGKKMSDTEFSSLIKATHAEAGAGKKASQEEQAMIMASVLNRARTDQGGIMGALTAKNQFQSVTGTAADGHRASNNYLQGPDKDRLRSIEGATSYLDKISKEQKNFTAASSAAYGPGTNIGYRDKMLAGGGQVIGGSVFQTGMPTGSKSNANDKTTPASDSHTAYIEDLDKAAQAARDKLAATTAGPLNGYQSQLSGLNPSKTLPEKTDATQTAANLPVAGDDTPADLLSQILGSLDNLNHSNQQIASSTKKSVQLQS